MHAFKILDFNSEALDCNPKGYHGHPKGYNLVYKHACIQDCNPNALHVTMVTPLVIKIIGFKKSICL